MGLRGLGFGLVEFAVVDRRGIHLSDCGGDARVGRIGYANQERELDTVADVAVVVVIGLRGRIAGRSGINNDLAEQQARGGIEEERSAGSPWGVPTRT